MKNLQKTPQLFRRLLNSKTLFYSYLFWSLSFSTVMAQNPPGAGAGAAVKLVNPLKINSAEELLTTILEIVIILATPFIVFFIIYAGFLYVTARGNAEQITQANRALTYAIIGGVIIIGSVAIATIIKNIVSAF